jgi:hypothetical protein
VEASALALVALGGAGALLGAPHDVAAVRLAGVALAWWAAVAASGLLLLSLTLAPRGPDRQPPE